MKVEIAKLKLNRKELGLVYKNEQRNVANALEALAENWTDFEPVAQALEGEGKFVVDGYEVTKAMVTWEKKTKTVHEIKFTPSVIEPSFGIGRILYSLLEHSFDIRDKDEQRTYLKFRPWIAPTKVALLPLSKNEVFDPIIKKCNTALMKLAVSTRVDESGASLGRRYARADELGIPFCLTTDFQTVEDGTVTLRDRDSMLQIRAPLDAILQHCKEMCTNGDVTFAKLGAKYGFVAGAEEEGEKAKGEEAPKGKTFVERTIRGRFSRPTEV